MNSKEDFESRYPDAPLVTGDTTTGDRILCVAISVCGGLLLATIGVHIVLHLVGA